MHLDYAKLILHVFKESFAVKIFPGGGWLAANNDNRAKSDRFHIKMPTGAELCNKKD